MTSNACSGKLSPEWKGPSGPESDRFEKSLVLLLLPALISSLAVAGDCLVTLKKDILQNGKLK